MIKYAPSASLFVEDPQPRAAPVRCRDGEVGVPAPWHTAAGGAPSRQTLLPSCVPPIHPSATIIATLPSSTPLPLLTEAGRRRQVPRRIGGSRAIRAADHRPGRRSSVSPHDDRPVRLRHRPPVDAWQSGAWHWNADTRKRHANDLGDGPDHRADEPNIPRLE